MKELTNKQKIISAVLAILILAGIIVTCTVGLNWGLEYGETKRIEVAIGKEFDNKEVKQLAKEALGNAGSIQVEKVEFFEDVAAITVKDITEEQLESLTNKLNEKYELEQKKEDLKVVDVPGVKGMDLIKPYLIPMGIVTGIILIYLALRFLKLGIGKVIVQTILTILISELLLLAMIAIVRIPVNVFIIPLGIVLYSISLIYTTHQLEKKLEDKKSEEEK